jgi:hypothetical protein
MVNQVKKAQCGCGDKVSHICATTTNRYKNLIGEILENRHLEVCERDEYNHKIYRDKTGRKIGR